MPRKGSFGEISSIQHWLDKDAPPGVRPGYVIVKSFRRLWDELDTQGKATAQVTQNGVLQIFDFGSDTTVVDLNPTSSGTANRAARSDHHHKLDEDIAPTWTSPHAWVTPTAEITPATGALSLTATLPATDMGGAGVPRGMTIAVTSPSGSGTPTNQSHGIGALNVSLAANYTGSAASYALLFNNATAGTGTSVWEQFSGVNAGIGANRGIFGRANATTNGHNVGARLDAYGGAVSVGVAASSYQPKSSAVTCAVAGLARNSSNTNGQIAAFFGLYGPTSVGADFTPPTLSNFAPAVLVADNGNESASVALAKFCVAGVVTTTIQRTGAININGGASGFPTNTVPFIINRNDSTSVDTFQIATAGGTTVAAFDSSMRLRMRETATPSHLVDNGYVYTKQAASGRTELYYFDSNGVAAGVETQLTANGSLVLTSANFANPTASVGLTVVNGSATTAMRSDAAPPLDQTISPTWTGLHTFLRASDARSVRMQARTNQTTNTFEAEYWDAGPGDSFPWFALGAGDNATNYGCLKMGYLGSGSGRAKIQCTLNTTDAADANVNMLTIDLGTSVSAAYPLRISNSAVSRDYFAIGPAGTATFGYSASLSVDTTAAVSMNGDTSNISTLLSAFSNSLQHSNTGVTPSYINGLLAVATQAQATTGATNGFTGVRSACNVIIAADTTGATAIEMAAVAGLPGMASTATLDRPAANSALRGNWKRVSAFRAGFIGSKASAPSATLGARPLILSALYAPMSPYVDGTTGQSWGVEIDSPTSTSSPTTTPVMGGIKIAFPLYGTRQMHIYYVPNGAQPTNNVSGDTYFDSGGGGQTGLWEYTAQWDKLLSGAFAQPTTNGGTALGGNGKGWSALWLKDTAAAFELTVQTTNTSISADRTLTIEMGDANRTLDLRPSTAYTPTNVTTDRSYDANATTVDELADVLGTLIADLQAKGILG